MCAYITDYCVHVLTFIYLDWCICTVSAQLCISCVSVQSFVQSSSTWLLYRQSVVPSVVPLSFQSVPLLVVACRARGHSSLS